MSTSANQAFIIQQMISAAIDTRIHKLVLRLDSGFFRLIVKDKLLDYPILEAGVSMTDVAPHCYFAHDVLNGTFCDAPVYGDAGELSETVWNCLTAIAYESVTDDDDVSVQYYHDELGNYHSIVEFSESEMVVYFTKYNVIKSTGLLNKIRRYFIRLTKEKNERPILFTRDQFENNLSIDAETIH